MTIDWSKVLGRWTGARVVFPAQSASSEPWAGPYDQAAPVPTSGSRLVIGPQHEIDLTPREGERPSARSGPHPTTKHPS